MHTSICITVPFEITAFLTCLITINLLSKQCTYLVLKLYTFVLSYRLSLIVRLYLLCFIVIRMNYIGSKVSLVLSSCSSISWIMNIGEYRISLASNHCICWLESLCVVFE